MGKNSPKKVFWGLGVQNPALGKSEMIWNGPNQLKLSLLVGGAKKTPFLEGCCPFSAFFTDSLCMKRIF